MSTKRGLEQGGEQSPAKRGKTAEHNDLYDLPDDSVLVHCTAAPNIAVIKYWGKREKKLILPINSSLSGTLHQDSLQSSTVVVASKSFKEDTMELNGKAESIEKGRIATVLAELRKHAQDFKDGDKVVVAHEDWKNFKIRIRSHNNFPTAAGLASSASGLACLTACLAELFNVNETFEGYLTTVARQGSGSACRSLFGGWAKWNMGSKQDGTDSVAQQVALAKHWPEIRVIILVVNAGAKETPSTSGMQLTCETSDLIDHRAKVVVPERMAKMEEAILKKDFESFAKITMQDSNQFHAVCLDTYPPISYMNDTSHRIAAAVHAFNDKHGVKAAYTYDAGPNCVIYTRAADTASLLFDLTSKFKPKGVDMKEFIADKMGLVELPGDNSSPLSDTGVRSMIVTKLGNGPKIIARKHSF